MNKNDRCPSSRRSGRNDRRYGSQKSDTSRKNEDTFSAPNNYDALLYISETSSNTIDRIKITFKIHNHKELLGFLKSNFKLVSHNKMTFKKKPGYRFVDIFKNSKGKKIHYRYPPGNSYHWHSIQFYQPTYKIQNEVRTILTKLDIHPLLSEIEFAVDSSSDELRGLKTLIESTLFQKYQKSTSFHIKGTYYTTNIRTKIRGIREYIKSINGKPIVRIELVLHRKSIKAAKIPFPLGYFPINLSKYYDFRIIDYQKMEKYLLKKAGPQIREANNQNPGYGDLIVQMVQSYLSAMDGQSLMKQVEWLKKKNGVENYSRFFRKIEIDGKPVIGWRIFVC